MSRHKILKLRKHRQLMEDEKLMQEKAKCADKVARQMIREDNRQGWANNYK